MQALDYLLKPINLEKITRVLERFLEEQPEEAAYTLVEVGGEATRLNLDNIIYSDANMGEISLVLAKEA